MLCELLHFHLDGNLSKVPRSSPDLAMGEGETGRCSVCFNVFIKSSTEKELFLRQPIEMDVVSMERLSDILDMFLSTGKS